MTTTHRPSPHSKLSLRLIALSLAGLSTSAATLFAATQTWTGSSSTDWSETGNWNNAAPGSGDTALFNTTVTNGNGTSNPVVIDSGRNIGSISFDTSAASAYVIGTTGGNALTVTSGGAITVNQAVINTQTLNAPLLFSGSYSLVNNASNTSASLKIGGSIKSSSSSGTTSLELSGSNAGANTISGVIANGTSSNTLRLFKTGTGTWTLSGTNTYTGVTSLRAGTLVLDFTAAGAPASNIINSASILNLGFTGSSGVTSAQLTLNGKAGTANTQAVNGVSFITSGAYHINANAGTGGSLALSLGALGVNASKSFGSTLDLATSGTTSLTTSTASAVTGTSSGLFGNAVTVNGNDFATNNGNAANAIVGLSSITGAYDTSMTVLSTLTKALDVQGNTSFTTSLSVPAIRINATGASTLTIAGTLTLGSSTAAASNNAILVTSNVGANKTTITGGSINGGTSRDLTLIQNNTLGSLEIASSVVNNSGSVRGLTKSGQGLTILSGTNTYTGITYLNEGTLQFAKKVSLYNDTSTSWTAANLNVAAKATLALNVGGTGEFTTSDVATISALGTATNGLLGGSTLGLDTTNAAGSNFTHGTAIANTNGGANAISLKKIGANTLTLTGVNTYTGGTIVDQGTLALTQSFSMGAGSENSFTIRNTSAAVAGTDYAQLAFSGATLTYGGSLSVFINGAISADTVYDLISYVSGGAAGDFSSVSIAGSYETSLTKSGSVWSGENSGISFSFDQTTGDLTVTSAVPEPSTVAAMSGVFALLFAATRRRRSSL